MVVPVAASLPSGLPASERTIAVHPALAALFPQGLQRGTTLRCDGAAATSMAILVATGAVQAGAWVGVAGLPMLGVQACREAGLPVDRMVSIREPAGGFDDATWGQVVATLIDGFEIVVFGAAARLRSGTARRLQARLQSRGAVLVVVGDAGGLSCEHRLTADVRWHGVGVGHGHLCTRQLQLTLEGRRMHRSRREALWYPSPTGAIEPLQASAGSPAASRATTTGVVADLRRTG